MDSAALLTLLKRHWGYSEFRAKQETVVRSILDGRDVAVVMPTGGGKSLCYQLPAVAMERTCVVVSPLIALMQDQAAGLQQAGIPAAFLNSALDSGEQREIKRRVQEGAFRLLYLSPERLVRDDVLDWLKRVPLGFFAIDEAHCISEWGHEFRPEYRQLRALREWFPETPVAAFTASATRAVRHDIVAQLRLRDPARIVLSFHRPNLRYIARQCGPREQDPLLYAALDYYTEGNVIVYAPTIKSVEETAALLSHRGLPVVAYHGQMDNTRRQKNQEAWMSGEKRILVGTVAFGLGINKAGRARSSASFVAEIAGTVLSGGGTSGPRRSPGGLRDALAETRHRAAGAFHSTASGPQRAQSGVGSLQSDAPIRGSSRVPASADLSALRRDSEMESLRRLRSVRRRTRVAGGAVTRDIQASRRSQEAGGRNRAGESKIKRSAAGVAA